MQSNQLTSELEGPTASRACHSVRAMRGAAVMQRTPAPDRSQHIVRLWALVLTLSAMSTLLSVRVWAGSKGGTDASDNAGRPRVTLPEGWIPKAPPKTAKVDQFAANTDAGTYFELVAEPREDFAESVDLPAWAKLIKEQSSKTSKLVNRKDTDLTAGKVADHDTQEYEVTGEINGSKLHYRIMMVRVGDWFVKLTCWTTPSRWKAAQPKFDELVDHLK